MPPLGFNQGVLEFFNKRIDTERLAHAYLLIAPQHAGKLDTALAIAQLVNCDAMFQKPCGSCASCVKIANGNHADIIVIANDDEAIKVEQVRGLLSRSQLRTYEARVKVFIIPNCERMTIEAANAFLKTLEEPAAHTLMLLTTSKPDQILATIKSRCQWVRFAPNGQEYVRNHLTQLGATSLQSQYIAQFSEGWLPVAQSYYDDGLYQRKATLVDSFIVNGLTDELIKEFVDEPKVSSEALVVLMSLIRDAFVLQATRQEELVLNSDQIKQVRLLSGFTPTQLSDLLMQVKQIKVQIDENLNAKMAWQILKEHLWNTLSK